MKFQFWSLGKSHESYVSEGIDMFTKRMQKYYPVSWQLIATPKNAGKLTEAELKMKEAELILALLKKEDYLVLLDERGKQMSSIQLADFLQKRANESEKTIVFLVGGAFGVADVIAKRANYTWSLSPLVFPHQMVRLLLAEQVYRACTINRNEKYHHL